MKERREKEIIITTEDDSDLELAFTLFKDCYIFAMKQILGIALREREEKEGNIRQNRYLQFKDVNNILSFVGARGVGKTTALNEFCHILKKFNADCENNYFEKWLPKMYSSNLTQKFSHNVPYFVILPLIDASLLEEEEDPFLLILASMFEMCEKAWKKESYDYDNAYKKRQDILTQFSEVYRNYYNLQPANIKRGEDLGESVISKLKAMPSTKKTKYEFNELMKLFFHTLGSENHTSNFMVVVIDDLDLNISHGFQILDHLYKYLSHPNIIIITALDYGQISAITENHFRDDMNNINISPNSADRTWAFDHCRKLATDYLDKLLLTEQRIYMPDLIKPGNKVYVKENRTDGVQVELKKYILQRIAAVMHIYYDINGKKRHFSEPDTVRLVVSYCRFLEAFNEVDFSDCSVLKGGTGADDQKREEAGAEQSQLMKRYNQNYEWFNSDINEHMLYIKTTPAQRVFYKQLICRDIERRARYLIIFKEKWLKGEPLVANIDNIEYRYGDLLECIYTWGRMSLNDKPLIHCILASFTSEMVREYVNYMYNGDQKSAARSKTRLVRFLGKGFMNLWLNEMLPPITGGDGGIIERSNYQELQLKNIRFTFHLRGLEHLNSAVSSCEITNESADLIIKELLSRLQSANFLKILQCTDMLLSNCRMSDMSKPHISYKFEVRINAQEKPKTTFDIRCGLEGDTADFDIMGFVGKSIEKKESLYEYTDLIIGNLAEAFAKFLDGKEIEDEYIKKIRTGLERGLKKQSMFAEKNIQKDEIAYPFYDLDVSYNILKRVRSRCKEEFIYPVSVENFASYIGKIYSYIGEEFEKQREEYASEEAVYSYDDIFNNYPYIKTIADLAENNNFSNVVRIVLNAGTSLKRPENTDNT